MNNQQQLDLEEFFDSPYYDAAHAFLNEVLDTVRNKLINARAEDPNLSLHSAAYKGAEALLKEFERERHKVKTKRAE